MRILLAQYMLYAPNRGGARISNRVWLEGLAGLGHSCRAIARTVGADEPGARSRYLRELAEEGVDIDLSTGGTDIYRSGGVEVHAVGDYARMVPEFIAQINQLGPDRILVSSEDPQQALLSAALDMLPGRVVYLAHTPQVFPFGPASYARNPAGAALLKQVAGIVAIGYRTASYIREWTGLNPVVIHPPVYGNGSFPNYGSFDSGFITIINPSAVKGISIFQKLARELPQLPFAALLGWSTTPADRAELGKLSNIRLFEPVPRIDDILSSTRVLLVPSLYHEGFGMVVVEAMLRGIPVLASDFGGLPEAKLGIEYVLPVRPIEHFEEHLDERGQPVPVVPTQDIGPWIEALSKLTSNRARYERLSERSRSAAIRFVSSLDVTHFERFLATLQHEGLGREH